MRTIEYGTPLLELYEEWLYTHTRLDADPLTQTLATEFVPLQQRWETVHDKELELIRRRARARAAVTVADIYLDRFLESFDHVLLALVSNDRESELYRRFFGDKRPAQLKRPVLGEQLETMASWPATLAKLESEALRAQGEALTPLVKNGQAAENALKEAVQATEDFYALGEHRTFVDELNAARSQLSGQLGKLRHGEQGLHLGSDFAEQFFLREERSRGPTIASEKRTLERLEQQLARRRQILTKLETEEAARIKDAETQAQLEKELETLEAQQRTLSDRETEVRKKLGRKPRR